LKTFHADKVFLGINSIDLTFGLSTANIYEAEVKRMMLHSAERKILLADHSKFGAISMKFIAHIEELDCIITDDLLPDETRHSIEQPGTTVLIVPAKNPGI
jgi:DeoR/GlpR family transcriptional regulator of sugar metabolism